MFGYKLGLIWTIWSCAIIFTTEKNWPDWAQRSHAIRTLCLMWRNGQPCAIGSTILSEYGAGYSARRVVVGAQKKYIYYWKRVFWWFYFGPTASPMLKLIWAEVPPKRAQFGIQLRHIGSRVGPKLELSGTPVPGRRWRGTEPFWEESSCLGPPGNDRSVPQPDPWPAAKNKTLPKPAWTQTLGLGAGYPCPGWQSLPKSASPKPLGFGVGYPCPAGQRARPRPVGNGRASGCHRVACRKPLGAYGSQNRQNRADFKNKNASFYRGQRQIRTLGPFGAARTLPSSFWELSGSLWESSWEPTGNIENFSAPKRSWFQA